MSLASPFFCRGKIERDGRAKSEVHSLALAGSVDQCPAAGWYSSSEEDAALLHLAFVEM